MKKQLLLSGLLWFACSRIEEVEIPRPSTQASPEVIQPKTLAASTSTTLADSQPTTEPGVGPLQSTPSSELTFVERSQEEETLSRRILQELDLLSYPLRGTTRYDAERDEWIPFSLPDDARLVSLTSTAQGTLLGLTATKLLQSTDKGMSWVEVSTLAFTPEKLWIDAKGALFVFGLAGEISRSRDQGKTWELLKAKVSPRVLWADDAAIYATTTDGKLMRSTNQGDTWTAMKTPTKSSLVAVWGDKASLYIAGAGGVALQSANRGKTWSALKTGTRDTIFSVIEYGEYVYLAGADLLFLRCKGVECETISSFDSFVSAQAIPPFMYDSAIAELSAQQPALTKLIAGEDALWITGEQGVVFTLEDPASQKGLALDDSFAPADEETIKDFFLSPAGDAYLVSAQEQFYGLEAAKRGIAERDPKQIKDGFVVLNDSNWAFGAGFGYGLFLSTPPRDGSEFFKDAIEDLAKFDEEKPLEALLWSFLGQSAADKNLAQFAYLYSQQLVPSALVEERSKALGVCLATITTPNKKATPIANWLTLWKKTKDIDETADALPDAPKNNKEAQEWYFSDFEAGAARVLHQYNKYPPSYDLEGENEEEIYHVVFLSDKKKLSGFLSFAKNYEPGGRVSESSPLQEKDEIIDQVLHVTLTQQQVIYPEQIPEKIGETITDLFFDIPTQKLVLQIEQGGYAAHEKDKAYSFNDEASFTFFAKVSVEGDEVKVTGGGCDQTISLKK